jgi:hypothetical protein
MSDTNGEYITLADAAREFPNRPHTATVIRWAMVGVTVSGGRERVKLGTTKIGGRRYTSRADIDEFLARLNASPNKARSVTLRRARDMARAEEEMDAEGIE